MYTYTLDICVLCITVILFIYFMCHYCLSVATKTRSLKEEWIAYVAREVLRVSRIAMIDITIHKLIGSQPPAQKQSHTQRYQRTKCLIN